jgi:hypothetical protein
MIKCAMEIKLSKSKIDQLGERLKNSIEQSENDLRILSEYKISFEKAYTFVGSVFRKYS